MKAWVLRDINEIYYEEADRPGPSENEVLVAVKAAGICGSDIPRIYRTGAHVHPLIPGHEFSGQVIQVGKNVDQKWMDQRVGIFPLIPCNNCAACQKRHYELCRSYSYLGSRRDGGFAELLIAFIRKPLASCQSLLFMYRLLCSMYPTPAFRILSLVIFTQVSCALPLARALPSYLRMIQFVVPSEMVSISDIFTSNGKDMKVHRSFRVSSSADTLSERRWELLIRDV